jgi:hypothetical protein
MGIAVEADESLCDATLTIALTCEALKEEYSGGRTCYTGAQAQGQVLLTGPSGATSTVPVNGSQNPPFFTSRCPEAPADAPFAEAWSPALLDGLAHFWGPQALIQVLKDEDVQLREAAVKALGAAGPEEGVIPALVRALEDEDANVRWAAAAALLDLGPATLEAAPALVRALGDEYSLVRETAAQALGGIGPHAVEAVPALIQALGDEGSRVRTAAAEALAAITGEDYGEDADGWRAWWEER